MRSRSRVLLTTSIGALAVLSLTATPSAISLATVEDDLLRTATLVFSRAVDTSAAAIPPSVMVRARGIAIMPAAEKDGVLHYGLGVLSVRGAGPDAWTPPAAIAVQGAIPLNLESDTVDFLIIATSAAGADRLIRRRFDSPVTHGIAAGPLGQDARGVAEMPSINEGIYGRPYSTDDIVTGRGFFRLPPAASKWRDALLGYFGEMS